MENFINAWFIQDLTICDKIIEYHRCSSRKESGKVFDDASQQLIQDKSIKDSTDVMLDMDTPLRDIYIDELTQVVKKYIDVFPYCSWSIPWGVVEKINIQQYQPGGGFYQWHCERSNGQFPATARHLVFMTYLNDVTDQGETEFFHQKIKIKPQKGLTVIWPADWTYTHRGISSPTQEKFIVTGWLSFLDVIQDQPVKI
jgi:hypothetical protein